MKIANFHQFSLQICFVVDSHAIFIVFFCPFTIDFHSLHLSPINSRVFVKNPTHFLCNNICNEFQRHSKVFIKHEYKLQRQFIGTNYQKKGCVSFIFVYAPMLEPIQWIFAISWETFTQRMHFHLHSLNTTTTTTNKKATQRLKCDRLLAPVGNKNQYE